MTDPARSAELVRRRIGGLVTYRRWLLGRTATVHWARKSNDFSGKPWIGTACGCDWPYRKGEMNQTDDSISCKRCAAMQTAKP